MSIQNTPLMKAMSAKMQYLNKRQDILSQNIANADTPDYQSRDLTKVDFGRVLKNVSEGNKVAMATTNSGHMGMFGASGRAQEKGDRMTYEVAPDGNGVILEEQMVKASETMMEYNLMTNLMNKQMNMYRLALGRQQ